MESWRKVFREGFAPLLSTAALEALRNGLLSDDPNLFQGATVCPPPVAYSYDFPVEKACALGYCGWKGEGLQTVGEVEEYFAKLCFEADSILGDPAACRYFLNWFDDTPREEVRRLLANEINTILQQRKSGPTFVELYGGPGGKLPSADLKGAWKKLCEAYARVVEKKNGHEN